MQSCLDVLFFSLWKWRRSNTRADDLLVQHSLAHAGFEENCNSSCPHFLLLLKLDFFLILRPVSVCDERVLFVSRFFSWRKWRGPLGLTRTSQAESWLRRLCRKVTGESARVPWRDGQTGPSARCPTQGLGCCASGLEMRCVLFSFGQVVPIPSNPILSLFFLPTCGLTAVVVFRACYGAVGAFFGGGEAVWPSHPAPGFVVF